MKFSVNHCPSTANITGRYFADINLNLSVVLPAGLMEIDVAAFDARSIRLYAPVGSAAEALLIDAGYALNAFEYTLTFEANGGRWIEGIEPKPAAK